LIARPHSNDLPVQSRHKVCNGWVQSRAAANGAGMGQSVAADQGDQVDVAERIRPDEQRGRYVHRLVGETPDQRRRRELTFGQSSCDVPARSDRNQIEEREREVLELSDFTTRRPRQRTEGRNRGAEQALGLESLALDRDLPEIGRGHGKNTPDTTRTDRRWTLANALLASRPTDRRSN
jgi:hypothetical protein